MIFWLLQLPAPTGVALPPAPVIVTPLDPAIYAAAIITVLSSLAGTVILIINAWSSYQDRREAAAERKALLAAANAAGVVADATGKKADEIITGVAKVHELTNSTASNLQKSLEVMTEKFAGAEKLVAQMGKAAADIAAKQATQDLQLTTAMHTSPAVDPPRTQDSRVGDVPA